MSKKIKRYTSGRRTYTHWDSSTVEVKVIPKPLSKPEPLPKIDIDDQTVVSKFSNMFAIGSREGEFAIDFYQVHNNKAKLQYRIISTDRHTKRFYNALKENIKKYEEKFGGIK